MSKYLNENGVKILWDKTKEKIAEVRNEALSLDEIDEILNKSATMSFVVNKYSQDGSLYETNEYQCEEGMTWAEFCDSEYNPILSEAVANRHFIYNEIFVMHGIFDASVSLDGVDVKPSDVIISTEYLMYL